MSLHRGSVVPFLFGAAVGGLAGAVIGALVGRHVVDLAGMAINEIDRRLTDDDRDNLRFELLLQ